MSDVSVAQALRSSAPLVVVESPAGCGKTYQGAAYVRELASSAEMHRTLILTHTHGACGVFADRTRGSSGVHIRTIDSLIGEVGAAYHEALGLPADVSTWVRSGPKKRHAELAGKVARLLDANPLIARAMADRFNTLVCDEHQDSSQDQHAVVLALHAAGARVRIFADPMQCIFSEGAADESTAADRWASLLSSADSKEQLDTPHRWSDGCLELGHWTLAARETLKQGGQVDLTHGLPRSVQVLVAENEIQGRGVAFRAPPPAAGRIRRFADHDGSLMVLTLNPQTAQRLRPLFYRRMPLWEGHTRYALDRLTAQVESAGDDCSKLAVATATFLQAIGTGFSKSAFGTQFCEDAADGCSRPRRGKRQGIQDAARAIVNEPSHRGVAECLRRVQGLRKQAVLKGTTIDCVREFWDAVALGDHDSIADGMAAITHRRSHARPKPPTKCLSTVHKAKGLEAERAIVMPIDAHTFPDTARSRRVLYVALSRASKEMMLVVSRRNPSPLVRL